MTELSVTFSGEFAELWSLHMKGDLKLMQRAATQAIREGRDIADPIIRADIKGAGDFSKRWYGKALFIKAYPQAPAASLAATLYVTHKIPYAGVFEDGEVLHGRPFLWLPLGSERVGARGSNRLLPRNFEARTGQKLIEFPGAHGQPLLGFRGRVRNKVGRAPRRVTFTMMKAGTSGDGGSITTIPVFVGLRLARIGQKFHIGHILNEKIAPLLPSLYLRAMETIDG